MEPYHKIETILQRDPETRKVTGVFKDPFFHLSPLYWNVDEKIDGTNIRVMWDHETQTVSFNGRTDNAQMPVKLMQKLQELFPVEKFLQGYADISLTLYGEGYGKSIQKVGWQYIPDGVSFILFDVKVGGVWLDTDSRRDIATKLGIDVVPEFPMMRLPLIVSLVKTGFESRIAPGLQAEGVIVRPVVRLLDHRGNRIIGKLKTRDF